MVFIKELSILLHVQMQHMLLVVLIWILVWLVVKITAFYKLHTSPLAPIYSDELGVWVYTEFVLKVFHMKMLLWLHAHSVCTFYCVLILHLIGVLKFGKWSCSMWQEMSLRAPDLFVHVWECLDVKLERRQYCFLPTVLFTDCLQTEWLDCVM